MLNRISPKSVDATIKKGDFCKYFLAEIFVLLYGQDRVYKIYSSAGEWSCNCYG